MKLRDSHITRGSNAQFHTTQWSLVINGAQGSKDALNNLCRLYWYPLYAYVRRSGCDRVEAEDVTQGFFLHLIESKLLNRVRAEQGRFRSFLLACIKNFLLNQRDKARTQKRGSGQVFAWEGLQPEERYKAEPVNQTAEGLFDAAWAASLVNHAMAQLRSEWNAAGRVLLFDALIPYLTSEVMEGSDDKLAARLSIPQNTLKSHRHRLRRAYVHQLKQQIRDTLQQPSEREVQEELRYLLRAHLSHAAVISGSSS
jgi:RNA polymerase sigma-70 factor (ECF subfamily)